MREEMATIIPQAAQFSAADPDQAEQTSPPTLRRPRLVIADDDPVAQCILRASLGLDFEVVGIANDGEQAIELAKTNQPDAALVDLVMPRGGGLRAIRGILEASPITAVVMISGQRPRGTVRQLLKLGTIAYCRKGIDPRLLADFLRESIELHTAASRESAWTMLAWHCAAIDHRSRPEWRRRQA
jgi:DNA-binding NarL/FixJ family response regulator